MEERKEYKVSKRYLGSVCREKGSPYYWGQVMIDGKRYRKSFTRNKATSLELFRKWRIEMKDNRGVKSWDWYKEWFTETIISERAAQTKEHYKRTFEAVDRIIQPKLLSDFTPEKLGDFRLQLKKEADEKGCGVFGINKFFLCLKTALQTATDNDYVKNLKIKILKSFTAVPKPLRIYKPWELTLIYLYAKPTYKAMALLMCRAGLRPEETCNLLKENINWTTKTGMIEPHKARTGVAAWKPKVNTIRPFTIEDKYLFSVLQSMPETKSPYVLTNKYGEPFTEGALYASWRKELSKINEKIAEDLKNSIRRKTLIKIVGSDFTGKLKITGDLKMFRKTFSTQLEENPKVKNEDISFLVGHRPKGMTDTHYFVKDFEQKRHIVKFLVDIQKIKF